jgi:hypothetical protein
MAIPLAPSRVQTRFAAERNYRPGPGGLTPFVAEFGNAPRLVVGNASEHVGKIVLRIAFRSIRSPLAGNIR